MTGNAALPILPRSALRGLPAATELFTIGLRRFYAFTLAAALAGERSWVIVVHPGWRLGEQRVRHIIQAGWPAIGNAQAVAVIQPAPLPQDPEGLFQRAAAGVRWVRSSVRCWPRSGPASGRPIPGPRSRRFWVR
jgi:hypothetical protein